MALAGVQAISLEIAVIDGAAAQSRCNA